jgi:hypothetical protein
MGMFFKHCNILPISRPFSMIKFWFRYNWHWLSASIVFSASVLVVAIASGFNPKWAYNTVQDGMPCLLFAIIFELISRS